MKVINKRVYESNEMLELVLEYAEGQVFIHIEVYEWSRPILRYIQALWEQVSLDLFLEGYDGVFSYNMNEKFCKLATQQEWDYVLVNDMKFHYTKLKGI